MQQGIGSWRVGVTCPGEKDVKEDRPSWEMQRAVDWANEKRRVLMEEGHQVPAETTGPANQQEA
jgi:hypothetical protein